MFDQPLSRRSAVKLLVGGGIALYIQPLPQAFCDVQSARRYRLSQISPIDRTLPDIAPATYYADDPGRAHRILWDKAAYLVSRGGKYPKPRERVPLVVIGGGIAGLFSAYLLRAYNPVILEQAPRFGGNAKGQSWRGVDYSIGAAYFIEPTGGSEIDLLLRELGIHELWRIKEGEDPVALNGSVFQSFWSGETVRGDAPGTAQFEKLSNYFRKVLDGQEIPYPDIPIVDETLRPYISDLDRKSFRSHLETIAGGVLHPHIEAVVEHYCWSSFGGSSSELSAAAGVNFFAAEFGNLAILPGGNAAVAERALSRLMDTLPASNLRPSSLVIDIRVVDDGVLISYEDALDNLQTIHAKSVIMACPKFVTAKLLPEMEPERLLAIRQLRYRSYLVANVCLSAPYPDPFYDLYLAGDHFPIATDIRKAANTQGVTDVIVANYAQGANASTVLTLYRGFPFDGARADLFLPDSFQRYHTAFSKQIFDSILPLLKLESAHVADLRIARWGHPLPLAAPNLIAGGTTDILRKPFKNRVFFVEQDNWALPAFETSITEALLTAPLVAKTL